MGRRPSPRHDAQQRLLLAQTAARLIVEGGLRDYAAVKRKAAEQLGIHHSRNMPGNDEIESALREYQQLFHHHSQHQELQGLRQMALQAMRLLAPFKPRLVGAVLHGSADRNTPICLHLFADTPEQLGIFLLEHQIPYVQSERRVRFGGERVEQLPLFSFVAGGQQLELTLFPLSGLRQAPISSVDGRPQHRAALGELESLLLLDAAESPR